MTIDGIRSYWPSSDVNERQVIKFLQPLTLILGSNGCGKTTIIECLRMATTGKLPPNASHGATFVHDAKLSDVTEVKGQIRLRFVNVSGKKITVTRNYQATQRKKGGTPEYKQLESNVQMGKGNSASHRCADMDALVPTLMGVSPAVLEHVIFCHQEESNWVLGEPKVLKERFDAIFASTRYSKALEEIKKKQNEQKLKIKDLEGEEKLLSSHKEMARKLRLDKEANEETVRELKGNVSALKKEVDGFDHNLKKLDQLRKELADLNGKTEKLNFEIKNLLSRQEPLEETLRAAGEDPDDFDESSMEDVTEARNKLQAAMENGTEKRDEVEGMIVRASNEVAAIEASLSSARQLESDLRAEMQQFKNRVNEWKKNSLNVSNRLGLGFTDETLEIRNEHPSAFCKKVKEVVDVKDKEYAEMRKKHSADLDKIRMQLAELENKCKSNEGDMGRNREELQKARAGQAELKGEIEGLERRMGTHAAEKASLQEKEKQLEQKKAAFDENSKKAAMEGLLREEQEKKATRKQLAETQKAMSADYDKRLNHNRNVSELEALEQKIEDFFSMREGDLRDVLGRIPAADAMENELTEAWSGFVDKVDELEKQHSEYKDKKSKLTSRMGHVKDSQSAAQAELERLELETNDLRSGGVVIDAWEKERAKPGMTLLAACEETIVQLEEKITSVKHADHDNEMTRKVIQKYIKKAEHSKSCPLCNRDFNEDDEEENTAAFIAVLKAQLAEGGEKKGDKVAVDKEIEALIEQKEVMVRARSKFEKARDKRKEIEESGSVIEDLERQLELIPVPVQDELDEARGSLKKCEELQKFSQSELSIKKLAELKAAVAQFNAANGGAAAHGGLSKEDVDRQVEQLDAEIERISDERGLAQGTFDMHKAEVHRLHEAVNDARQRVGKLALDEEKLADRRARLLDVDARIGGIVQEFENLRESKAPNEAKLKQTRAELSRVQAEHEKDEKRLGGEQRDLNRDLSSVQSLERDIYQFVSGNKEQALERKRKEKEELEKKLSEAQAKREIAEKEKSQIEAAVEGEMTHLRRLNDVAELIGLKKKIKERQVEMKSARQAIKGLPADDDVVKGFTDITKQREKVRREIDESNGKIESLNTFIKQFGNDLAQKKYENVEEKHKMCSINLVTIKSSQADLTKYYQALDRALMRFHEMKMEEINKLIKEYWQSTYKGVDIETIEIKADVETSATRRSHNYRLVMMYKSSAKLDMRGRCSAGQKVLASLVVRLALAESFCANCGILALDEPTSNLDHHNIDGFTEALANIVKVRQSKGFQLLVISHDDDFIEKLARETSAESYYRVSKDPDTSASKITKYDVTHLE